MSPFTASLTILICTHNRAALLERVIASLNTAVRPALPVRILVAANACTDDTVARMNAYRAAQPGSSRLPLDVLEVPTPGKSHALNTAIPRIDSEIVAFVDDDHRVDANYLVAIEDAVRQWPDASLYCGRILPDWDGTEPAWVHDEGPYRIYPLPVPRYDQGDVPKTITAQEGPIPGGGNLAVRREVFDLCGQFSTELGPHGHDLGGGEDSEYVLRALERGLRCQYQPAMIQYHYVDNERLTLSYLMRKGYQRTRSTSRIRGNGRVPLYMWRKVGGYAFRGTFCLSWAKRRFYWVRTAAALGELQGRGESGHRGRGLTLPADGLGVGLWLLALLALAGAATAWLAAGDDPAAALWPIAVVAAAGTGSLLWKSILDFSRTGPSIRNEILAHYRRYSLYALARLGLWSFALMSFLAGGGVLVYGLLATSFGWSWSVAAETAAAVLGLLGAATAQFVRLLRFNPGLLVASMHYRMARLHPLWRRATAKRIRNVQSAALAVFALLLATSTARLAQQGELGTLLTLWGAVVFYVAAIAWTELEPESRARPRQPARSTRPNILMMGADTLRSDRLGALGYHRRLTPNLDALGLQGSLFTHCYVPCARTAPSLVSLFTGTWPQRHGIRDNFVADEETRLTVDALPALLKSRGYNTASLSDWCGADLGKFSFGFALTDLPEDQWNLKYLIRQGPKDLRLFISAFTHNRLGRLLLPEVFYLGGVPLTDDIGRRSRRLLSRLAADDKPFLLNVFYSTTHPPFASEWPWYEKFADPAYDGSSRFAMAKLNDPFDIIRRQGEPREEFDLDHIIDLYDGCVAQFDDEVGKMLAHLAASGLAENTIVVVYSDHGMEFFEHDTWGQGNSAVGDHSARIPLIVRAPGMPARGVVADVVRSIDIAPTLLALTGSPPAPSMEGVSLVPLLRDEAAPRELEAYNETGLWLTPPPGMDPTHLRYPNLLEMLEVPDKDSGTLAIKTDFQHAIVEAKDRMLREGRWKLVYQPLTGGYRLCLYDVANDPGCHEDVSGINAVEQEQLWLQMQPFLVEGGSR
ncbi:sulfatase-like hydrolase/transferase [Thauera sinica]|uniref:Sulfatase-like hydrolase/transferase n=1 Tax=Thauera sinica TaxID=2665146 RepID=A0ABW1AMC0_9RHOO|nr:sulfatase-like hydrolase/transferase [Thauera sp. K11]ATE60926.1 arylsulfatase [Thauera sp. K11]